MCVLMISIHVSEKYPAAHIHVFAKHFLEMSCGCKMMGSLSSMVNNPVSSPYFFAWPLSFGLSCNIILKWLVCNGLCIYIYIRVYIYKHTHIYRYIYTYTYTYTYIYIFVHIKSKFSQCVVGWRCLVYPDMI